MMNSIKHTARIAIISFSFLLIVASSVNAQSTTVEDYYTTVDRLFLLNEGMTLGEVNSTLASEPYEVVQNTLGGYLILEYKYVKKYRLIRIEHVDDESNRTAGKAIYEDASSAYLLFDNDLKLHSYVTQDALGAVRDAYKLEMTVRNLGSLEAPCANNCRISMPTSMLTEKTDEDE